MRGTASILVFAIGCWSQPPAPAPPTDHPVETELRCKTAVERASGNVKLDAKDVTMAIGQCEQKEWSRQARECVAAAHASADLAACGTKHELGNRGIFADRLSFDQALVAMEQFRDQMCACKDTACAQHVSDEMVKWSQDMAKTPEPPTMSEEETKRATMIGESMGKCMQTAMGAGMGPP